MKHLFGLILWLFFIPIAISAQQPVASPTPPTPVDEEEIGCGLRTELVVINVWVMSSKKGFLRNLTYKNFEIYDEKTRREVEFFSFDGQSNQYIIAFYPEDYALDNKWREVKVKVKLSAEEKKEFGKTSVSGQTGYYPNQN